MGDPRTPPDPVGSCVDGFERRGRRLRDPVHVADAVRPRTGTAGRSSAQREPTGSAARALHARPQPSARCQPSRPNCSPRNCNVATGSSPSRERPDTTAPLSGSRRLATATSDRGSPCEPPSSRRAAVRYVRPRVGDGRRSGALASARVLERTTARRCEDHERVRAVRPHALM